MPQLLFDAILPTGKTSRPADAATPRAGERAGEFAPVLNQALDARPSAPPAAGRDDDERADEPAVASADIDAASESGQSSSDDDAGVGETAESGDLAEASPSDADAEEADAVEISAEAEAAAAEAAAIAAATIPAAPDADADSDLHAHANAEIPAVENPTDKSDATNPEPEPAATDAAANAIPAASDDAAANTATTVDLEAGKPEENGAPGLTRAATPTKDQTRRNPQEDAAESADQVAPQGSNPAADAGSTSQASQASTPQGEELAVNRTDVERDSTTASRDAEPRDAAAELEVPTTDVSEPAALETIRRTDATGGESQGVTAKETDNPGVAPAAQPTPDAARSPALSRLATERSLHAVGEASGDNGGIDRGRFVGRVEGAIRTAQQRDGRIQVRLAPPELGALRIELTIQQGALAARLEAETPAARNLLLDNLPALRERLAAQDIRVERFDVDLRQDAHGQGGSSHQGAMQERQPREGDWRQNQLRIDRERATATGTPATPRRAGPAPADSGLDVRV